MTTPGTTTTSDAMAAASPALGAQPDRGPSSAPTPAEDVQADSVEEQSAGPAPTVGTYRDGNGRVHYASPHVKATQDKLASGEWTEVDVDESPFDPTGQKVRDVIAHLEANAADDAEVARVKTAEADGADRPTIASWSPSAPAGE